MTTAADLTPRQLAVAKLVAVALPDKRIAHELGMSTRRVRTHITALAFLLGCDPSRNVRVQVAMWWREQLPDIRRWPAA